MPGRLVGGPVEWLVKNHALRHGLGIVDPRRRQAFVSREWVIAARLRKVPIGMQGYRSGEGIEEEFVEIEAMPFAGLVGAVHSVGIELTRCNSFQPYVPDIAGTVARWIEVNSHGGLRVHRVIKEFQPNTGCMAAKDGKVDSASILMGSHG